MLYNNVEDGFVGTSEICRSIRELITKEFTVD